MINVQLIYISSSIRNIHDRKGGSPSRGDHIVWVLARAQLLHPVGLIRADKTN